MLDTQVSTSLDLFPDDPLKWHGWENYKAENPYERLCLNPKARPNDDQIQAHCTGLLQWWQKKLRLKSQPSNPLAQLLGRGIDEAPALIVEARMQLLDPEQRRQIDEELTARTQQETLVDFSKYVAFSLARRVLTAEAEANLSEYGQLNGLTEEQTRTCIEKELRRHKAQRVAPAALETKPAKTTPEAEKEFLHILGLSRLNLADATAMVRRAFATIAESLGIPLERAEFLFDNFLEESETGSATTTPVPLREIRWETPASTPAPSPKLKGVAPDPPKSPSAPAPPLIQPLLFKPTPSNAPPDFVNPIIGTMVLIPEGEFMMGSEEPDAAPNEQPITQVILSEFYMSRHPVTNAQYEQFDPRHRQKRIKGAGDDHPAVYVTSLEADKYCQWLGLRDGKNYRLPTEAEWEYAARGSDGRKFPWGDHARRGGSANFADASTTFPWRDSQINDGYPETSPVGAFPLGASFFGLEDMAGNVWEWCLDFYQPLPGALKRNPRVPSGTTRVYRGGSWKSRFSSLRTTTRSSNSSNYASNDVGFRVVCECRNPNATP